MERSRLNKEVEAQELEDYLLIAHKILGVVNFSPQKQGELIRRVKSETGYTISSVIDSFAELKNGGCFDQSAPSSSGISPTLYINETGEKVFNVLCDWLDS